MAVILSGNSFGKPITDATATADDIASGKIAYNNDGRLVGTAIIPSYNKFRIPQTTSYSSISVELMSLFNVRPDGYIVPECCYSSTNSYTTCGRYQLPNGITLLRGFIINDVTYYMNIFIGTGYGGFHDAAVCFSENSSYPTEPCYFYLYNGYIYSGQNISNAIIDILY